MTDTLSRRSFLIGAIAAPLIVRSGILMPVRQIPHQLLGGDLAHGPFIGARIVDRVEGGIAYLWDHSYGPNRTPEPIPVNSLSLFHGLPGNRVDNPSMRNVLVRSDAGGLRYINGDKIPQNSRAENVKEGA